jgi:hypothetical protein
MDQIIADGASKMYDVGAIGVVCVILMISLWWRDKMARADLKALDDLHRADLKAEQAAHDKTLEVLRQTLLDRLADSQAYGKIGETVRDQLKVSDALIRQFIDLFKERDRQ